MLPEPAEIELSTSWLPVGRASDWATAAEDWNLITSLVLNVKIGAGV